jgi:Rod binding domain-containing protein
MTPVNATSIAQAAYDPSLPRQAEGFRQANALPDADRTRAAFTQFVGETFYAQMLKAMRTSLGKPAYFHGGRAEEIFSSQLHQTLAEELADKSTERLVEPMFRQQFPHLAAQHQRQREAATAAVGDSRATLDTLRRP